VLTIFKEVMGIFGSESFCSSTDILKCVMDGNNASINLFSDFVNADLHTYGHLMKLIQHVATIANKSFFWIMVKNRLQSFA